MTQRSQPWIYSPFADGAFILAVPFVVVAVTLAFHDFFSEPDSMTVLSWAILVMGVDVSHVYSSLYRTYLDAETRERHAIFLFLLPFVVLIACILLYAAGAMVFWRVMAYLAVFHFARQQYGFMRVYARDEQNSAWQRRIDALAIYTATFYPILDWHLAGQKNFNWFMKGDFYYLTDVGFRGVLFVIYLAVIGAYVVKEASLLWKFIARYRQRNTGQLGKSIAANDLPKRTINIPRNLLIAGTFLSWYVGIVHFNSDIAFTAINVISHGIPYMALVWFWGNKKYAPTASVGVGLNLPLRQDGRIFRLRYVTLFVGSLLILAYIEEGFWNAWVWHEKDHAGLFALFHASLTEIKPASPWLILIVPLLSVPQITHYVIDGFIWKMRKDNFAWRDITLGSAPRHTRVNETV